VKRSVLFVTLLMTALVCTLDSQNQAPVFKSKVEVVQLDVSVLDKNRQPVRGLTQQDFAILEEGKPQSIVGFSSFEIGQAAAPATGWMRDIPPDVATNEFKDSRLFVIVLDDALIPQDPFALQASKKIAIDIIEKLAAEDRTAVVFTGDNRKTQDFTNDKNKLRATVDKFSPGSAGYRFGSDSAPSMPGKDPKMSQPPVDADLWFYQSSARTLENVAQLLGDIPNRRKAVFWISPGIPMDVAGTVPNDKEGRPMMPVASGKLMCLLGSTAACLADPARAVWGLTQAPADMLDLKQRTERMFQNAQRANVTIYPIDPMGLGGLRNYLTTRLGPMNGGLAGHKTTVQHDYLASAAVITGGRAVMNTNEFEPGLKEVFAENESYYLLSFEPANTTADGKLRKLDVKVNRPDVDIRTRSSYYAPEAPKTDKQPAKPSVTPEVVALQKAMAGILPMAGMPLRVAAAPFAVPGQRNSTVAIVLGITQPVPATTASRITETTEILTSAFTPEGESRGAQRQTAKMTIRPGAGDVSYEALAKIDLPPGRYQLRLATHNETLRRDGSVFVEVVVPNYSNVPFSASPIVLSATPGLESAPRELLAPVLPVIPTAERTFARTVKVTSFLRLYQSGQKNIEGVRLAIRIRDASDQLKVDENTALGAGSFAAAPRPGTVSTIEPTMAGSGSSIVTPPRGAPATQTADQMGTIFLRSADVRYSIPVETLTPGAYLLTIEATLGSTTIRRDLRFSVR